MPKQPREQHVYLIPQRDEQNNVSWTWIYGGEFGSASQFPAINVQKGTGRHDLYFTIVETNPTIKFAGHDGPNATKAIWLAEKNPSTPKQAGINSGGQINNITFEKDGTQLKLANTNGREIVLEYQLNFVDAASGQTVTSIDPEIRNGGGDKLWDIIVESAAILIGGAVVGALLSLAFVRFVAGWRAVS